MVTSVASSTPDGMPLEALRYDVTPAGMHYLLVHFDVPDVDPSTWRLEIGGHVEAVGTAVWTGVPLRDVLAAVGLRPGALELVFSGADHGVQGGDEQDYERGSTLEDATLELPVGEFAWRGWSCRWPAAPGEYVLSRRATDAAGNVQPLEQPWNDQGLGNNPEQTVPVTVRPGRA